MKGEVTDAFLALLMESVIAAAAVVVEEVVFRSLLFMSLAFRVWRPRGLKNADQTTNRPRYRHSYRLLSKFSSHFRFNAYNLREQPATSHIKEKTKRRTGRNIRQVQ